MGLTVNWTVNKLWMPFGRLAWSDGDAPLANKTATAGFIRRFALADLFGLGFNWSDPPDPDLRKQKTMEIFYRIQIAQNLALTPSFQLLVDPANNSGEDQVSGLRSTLQIDPVTVPGPPSGMLASYRIIELMPSEQVSKALKRSKELIGGDTTVKGQ